MAHMAKERTNSLYTFTLRYEDGSPVTKAAVSIFKLSLFCLDDDAQTVLNSRNAQDVYHAAAWDRNVTMHDTSGLVSFAMQPADNAIASLAAVPKTYERHRVIFDVTASGKRIVVQDEILVENVETVTT